MPDLDVLVLGLNGVGCGVERLHQFTDFAMWVGRADAGVHFAIAEPCSAHHDAPQGPGNAEIRNQPGQQ